MGIPADILAVERPVNTVVHAYGKNKDRYSVIERTGCIRKNNHNQPVDGHVIGHIVNHVFVPVDPRPTQAHLPPTYRAWANVVLADRMFSDILDDLRRFYTEKDAVEIYCIAILRVCYPHLKDCKIKHRYEHSFLSLMYPGIGLCGNKVSQLQISLGSRYSVIQDFMIDRVMNIDCDDTILIDGTLKTDDSYVNGFSHFSFKGKIKGRKDISVLYSYDLQKREPVCSKVFPGNMLDATSYKRFLEEHNIQSGLIVDDKGFPPGQIREYLVDKPTLHYLTPIKRNAAVINKLDLHHYTDTLTDYPKVQAVKKAGYLENGNKLWYYSYKDMVLAADEVAVCMHRVYQNKPNLTEQERKRTLEILNDKAGTIVLESDQEMDLNDAYCTFKDRWKIETMMGYYKTACDFDDTREQYDESVIGSEFIDFFSTLLSCRLENHFKSIPELAKYEYKEIMTVLKEATKIKSTGRDWELVEMNPSALKILYYLDLYDQLPPARKGERVEESMDAFKKKKKGRPPKPKDPDEPKRAKRPRGRPPKEAAGRPKLKYGKRGRPSLQEKKEAEAEYARAMAQWEASQQVNAKNSGL